MFLTILPFRVYKNQEGLYKYIPLFVLIIHINLPCPRDMNNIYCILLRKQYFLSTPGMLTVNNAKCTQ